MKAFLILEDGTVFEGLHIGAQKEIISEIVFNTSMAGYVEVLTDPACFGQTVCMTYPLIGNYGVCSEDMESRQPWADGLIVKELSRIPSNFRCDMTIQQFLEQNNIPGIARIDTRALTKILRDKGTMNGMITTDEAYSLTDILPQLKAYKNNGAVEAVTCAGKRTVAGAASLADNGVPAGSARFDKEAYEKGVKEKVPAHIHALTGKGKKAALLDLGLKKELLDALTQRGCDVTIYPAHTKAEEILADAPDGIFLSGGPADPKECMDIVAEVKKLYESSLPMLAVGLGHQLVALAAGADTYKMKHGHRGSNHPVKELESGQVYITSQNHGYAVDMDKLDESIAVPAFVNVNDGSCEGLAYIGKNVITAQFYPESYPGQPEGGCLYDRFMKMMEVTK